MSPAIVYQLQLLRPEEAVQFFWSQGGALVSVVRTWKGKATYQMEGPVEQIEAHLRCVLPKTEFRDEGGLEPDVEG